MMKPKGSIAKRYSQRQVLTKQTDVLECSRNLIFFFLTALYFFFFFNPSLARGNGVLHFRPLDAGLTEKIRQNCNFSFENQLFGFSGEHNVLVRTEKTCRLGQASSGCETFAFNTSRRTCKSLGISEGNAVQDRYFLNEIDLNRRQLNQLGLVPFLLRLDGKERILVDLKRGFLVERWK
ncbi:MAG: hypothetical protein ABJF05_15745 [Paracoccaceae bacterium]